MILHSRATLARQFMQHYLSLKEEPLRRKFRASSRCLAIWEGGAIAISMHNGCLWELLLCPLMYVVKGRIQEIRLVVRTVWQRDGLRKVCLIPIIATIKQWRLTYCVPSAGLRINQRLILHVSGQLGQAKAVD